MIEVLIGFCIIMGLFAILVIGYMVYRIFKVIMNK